MPDESCEACGHVITTPTKTDLEEPCPNCGGQLVREFESKAILTLAVSVAEDICQGCYWFRRQMSVGDKVVYHDER